jgi:hypothetical protein
VRKRPVHAGKFFICGHRRTRLDLLRNLRGLRQSRLGCRRFQQRNPFDAVPNRLANQLLGIAAGAEPGDPEVFGKKIGGDILCNKKTYMLIKALNRADEKQHAELNRWLNAETFQPAEKIEAVTEIYNQLNIRNICESKMREYYTFAMESLAAVAVAEDRKKELKNLVKLLMYREM